jgi:hypothetical protein
VNIEEVKQILTIYRPGTRDAEDPEVAAALQLVKGDPDLSRWFEEHCARQNALREKFRQISLPAALKEQILSEQAVAAKAASRRRVFIGVAAVAAAIVVSLAVLPVMLLPHNHEPRPLPNSLPNYLRQMATSALTSYVMNTATNATQIQSYLAQQQAPSDFVLPAGLQKLAMSGCAVESWQGSKASMICFQTGKPLPPGRQSDLWLFIIDRAAVKGAASITSPQYAQAGGLITVAWTQDEKLYVLGTKGDEQAIQKFL